MRVITPIHRFLRRFFCVLLRRARSREVDGGSHNSSHALQPITRPGILGLPPELLQLIFENITDGWKLFGIPSVSKLGALLPRKFSTPLIPLSLVNREMRVLIRPLLFRIVRMDPTQLPPPGLWPHIHYLNVYTRFWGPWAISQSFLQQMPHLSSVYWYGEGNRKQEPLGHLLVFMTSSTLRNLTMSSIWLCATEDGTDLFIPASAGVSLRALCIDFPEHVVLDREIPPGFAASHLECLNSIFAHLRPRLESLTLSGYSTQLSSLAVAPWPSLRLFSVTRGPAVLDVPWMQLLGMMPQLRSLTIALERGIDPLFICPHEQETSVHARTALSHLSHLTVSHPSTDDAVFQYLPPDLLQLALRDTPRYYDARTPYRWQNSGQKEPILTCSEVLSIVGKMSLTRLEALELVYLEDGNEFEMLELLSQSCPGLRLLELHRYPEVPNTYDAWSKGTLTTPVESIADALAAFQSVRILKLNFCLVDKTIGEEYAGVRKPPDYWDRLYVFLGTQAQIIARRVPFVETLALLCWIRGRMSWRTWSVYHAHQAPGAADADEYPHLVYEDVYDKAYPGGMESEHF